MVIHRGGSTVPTAARPAGGGTIFKCRQCQESGTVKEAKTSAGNTGNTGNYLWTAPRERDWQIASGNCGYSQQDFAR
jgi:hypothetical protein